MPSANTTSMSPSEVHQPPSNHIYTDRSADRHQTASVEDYSRIMLEYTQRRLAGFAETEDRGYATSRSSRSSNTSGQSGNSTSGFLAGQAAGHALSKGRHDSTGDIRANSQPSV
ncbi:hypothetical protein BJX70DRAFT_398994 [Aspergillus crustosus]